MAQVARGTEIELELEDPKRRRPFDDGAAAFVEDAVKQAALVRL